MAPSDDKQVKLFFPLTRTTDKLGYKAPAGTKWKGEGTKKKRSIIFLEDPLSQNKGEHVHGTDKFSRNSLA